MTAAAISSLLCLPRLWLWPTRKYPLWYLEALLFLGGTVLWAFVFAWHTQYTGRPVFRLKMEAAIMALATAAGIAAAVVLAVLLDPAFRMAAPEDYPKSFSQWLAMTLFSLAFTQVFLVIAPFAWLMRLFRNQTIATVLTAVFGVCVAFVREHSSPLPLPGELLTKLLVFRAISSLVSLYFYFRGGAIIAWWFVFLTLSRHLVEFWSHG